MVELLKTLLQAFVLVHAIDVFLGETKARPGWAQAELDRVWRRLSVYLLLMLWYLTKAAVVAYYSIELISRVIAQ